MTAPVERPAEVTHDAVTAAMLARRRLLATIVLLGLFAACLYMVFALERATREPWLGLHTARGNPSFAQPGPRGEPVTVRLLRHDGPAARAGLRIGDRVRRIDGIAADDIAGLTARHDRLRAGDRVRYEIERDGQPLAVDVIASTVMHERRQWVWVAVKVSLVFALFLGIPSTVYKWRSHDPRALLFMIFGCVFGISMLNFTVPGATQPPESVIPLPDAWIRIHFAGLAITFLSAFVVSPTLLHFLALFPQPRLAPMPLARILRWAYLIPALVGWTASPILLVALLRLAPRPARQPLGWMVGLFLVTVGAIVLWRARRERTVRQLVLDDPLRLVRGFAPLYSGAALLAILALAHSSQRLSGMAGGLIVLISALLFSVVVGIGYPIASGLAMWRSWRMSADEVRQQIRWPLLSITWALGVALLLSVLSVGLSVRPSATPPAWLHPLFEVSTWSAYSVIPIAFAAAVLRYGLMDIRFIIRLTFFYLLTTASVFIAAGAIVLLVAVGMGEAIGSERVTTVLLTLLVVLLVEPLRRRVQRRVDKHFYQRTPDPVGVLARHGQALRTISRRDDLERRLVLALQEAMPHAPTYVFRRREDQGDFVAAHSPDPTARDAFEALPRLAARSGELHGPTPVAELAMDLSEARIWEQLGVELLLPVRHGEALPVVLGLGRKRSDGAWQDRDLELLASLAAQTSMALADIEARQHDASLREAFDNQRALLPQQLPQPETFSIAGAWHPALTVGGDYYDAWWLSEDAVAICVADVSGKGLAASLVMANLQATVKALAGPDVSPADLCTRVNESLAANLRRGRFVTFFYGVLRLSTSELRYANAGHNPPILVGGGHVHLLALGDPGLGLLRQHRYRDASASLDADARLLLFTDGVTEGRSPDGEDFGMTRLVDLVDRPHLTAGALRDDVLSTIAAFTQGQFDDDVTLLAVVRRQGAHGEVFQSQKIRLPNMA